MNCFRDQLLARTAFAGNENRRARGCHLFDQAKNFLHDVRAPNHGAAIDFTAHRLSQGSSFLLLATPLNSRSHRGADVFVLKRLANAVESALLPGGNRCVEGCVRRNHYDHRLCIEFQELFQRAQTANSRHRHVEQHRVVRTLGVRVQSFFAGLREIDAIALRRKQRLEDITHDLLIVNDQH